MLCAIGPAVESKALLEFVAYPGRASFGLQQSRVINRNFTSPVSTMGVIAGKRFDSLHWLSA